MPCNNLKCCIPQERGPAPGEIGKMFFQAGITVFNAIFQLFLIAFIAVICVRAELVSAPQIKALSGVTVNIFLPCMIMAKTVTSFHPGQLHFWWTLPLSGIAIVISGLIFSALLFRFNAEKKHFMVLAGMQNALYIVLPIGHLLFPDQFDLFALYCFLLVLGLNPIMWSLGKVMLAKEAPVRLNLKSIITPPLSAIFISVALVLFHLAPMIPRPVIAAMDLLGGATIPLAVFILGGTIGAISFKDLPCMKDIITVAVVKFILVPGCTFAVLGFSGHCIASPLICSMLMIQASSPPATNLALIAENYGGDTRAVSSMMLVQYLIAIVMMPAWIALWQYYKS